MSSIFISYSRKDLTFVERLAKDLKAAGLDIWYDLSGLDGGDRWSSEIQAAITRCDVFVVVLSPDSVGSRWVENEFLLASQKGKRIVPLLLKECELPLWSLTLHYVDVRGALYRSNWGEVLESLGAQPEPPKKKAASSRRPPEKTRPVRTKTGRRFPVGPLLIGLAVVAALVVAWVWGLPLLTGGGDPPSGTASQTAPRATDVPSGSLGSPERPIRLMIYAQVDDQASKDGGLYLAEVLYQETGLIFDLTESTSGPEIVDSLCEYSDDAIAFIPGEIYVFAHDACGVLAIYKGIQNGHSDSWVALFARRDNGFASIEDLDGRAWAYVDFRLNPDVNYALLMFSDAGITPGNQFGISDSLSAIDLVYNGAADVVSGYYYPPLRPYGESPWTYGDDPDIPLTLIPTCGEVEGLFLGCDGWQVMDARADASVRNNMPDIIQQVGIVALSPSIPNDPIVFGPSFPYAVREAILAALQDIQDDFRWGDTILGLPELYAWEGITPVTDAEYDIVRRMIALSGLQIDDFR